MVIFFYNNMMSSTWNGYTKKIYLIFSNRSIWIGISAWLSEMACAVYGPLWTWSKWTSYGNIVRLVRPQYQFDACVHMCHIQCALNTKWAGCLASHCDPFAILHKTLHRVGKIWFLFFLYFVCASAPVKNKQPRNAKLFVQQREYAMAGIEKWRHIHGALNTNDR